MPASTFEILSNIWEEENEVICKITNTCKTANLCLTLCQGHIEVRIQPSSVKSLVFEIRTPKTLYWYFHTYPMAKEEPDERIPYFVFNNQMDDHKYYSIVMANNYLDPELIWKFASVYLANYSDHIICLNREVFIDAKKMAQIVESSDYKEDWCFEIKHTSPS